MNIRTIITSIFSETHRTNRGFRIVLWLSLVAILCALITLFKLASAHSDFGTRHIQYFIIACAGCLYILVMTYYVKAQRDKTRRASEERYRSIIALSDIGAWEFHTETGYVWCSPEYFQMLGYDDAFWKHQARTIETVWVNMLHPDDRATAIQKFNDFSVARGGNQYENTFRLRHREGKWLWILSRSKALQKADGTRSKVILGSHIDITEKIATQIELRKRNQKLVNFAFSNAHHVRGPVARMLGLVDLVKIDRETDHHWYVQTISNEVRELDKIIQSISRDLEEIDERYE